MSIELRNIDKSYGNKMIFHDFSFTFEKGKIYAVTGKSGSGKTTLLNMISLLEKIDAGHIIINGEDKWNRKNIRKLYKEELSFLFQNYALIDGDTVEENLKMVLNSNQRSKIDEMLQLLNLKDIKYQKVSTLSGGQQQRVALARALLHDSHIMLCDEPTGNLDEDNKNLVMDILKHWITKERMIIMVTHDQELANQCDVRVDLDNLNND